jgi:hypothetical protein
MCQIKIFVILLFCHIHSVLITSPLSEPHYGQSPGTRPASQSGAGGWSQSSQSEGLGGGEEEANTSHQHLEERRHQAVGCALTSNRT